MTSGGSNFNEFSENQLTIDFAAYLGERYCITVFPCPDIILGERRSFSTTQLSCSRFGRQDVVKLLTHSSCWCSDVSEGVSHPHTHTHTHTLCYPAVTTVTTTASPQCCVLLRAVAAAAAAHSDAVTSLQQHGRRHLATSSSSSLSSSSSSSS